MIKVYTSDSGQYVLVHPASQTFIIDDNLEQGFRRLKEHLQVEHPEMAGRVMEVDEKSRGNQAANSRIAQLVLLVALALLPFIWLAVMQQSLATLLADLRFGSTVPAQVTDEQAALREELDLVRLELNRVIEALHTVNMQVLEMGGLAEDGAAPATAEEGAPAADTTTASETPDAADDTEDAPEDDAGSRPDSGN